MAENTPTVDLSQSVTVFLTTVGAPTFGACLEHLRAQDSTFRLEIIDHVAPLSAAFQRMLDTCTTPLFVPLDEDMLLYPHAIRTLHERISREDGHIAAVMANLYDVHLRRCIHAVKIFRHGVTRRYPFRDLEGCEVDQVRRMEADGYAIVKEPQEGGKRTSPGTLGLHGTQWTPQSIYERYLTLARRCRRDPSKRKWFPPYTQRFLRRYLKDPSELNFFALMGPVAAALAGLDGDGREKDFRKYEDLPGWKHLLAFYREVSAARTESPEAPPETAARREETRASIADS